MSNYKDEIRAMLAKMDKQENQGSQDKTQPPPADDVQDVYVLIVREHEVQEDQAQVVDSTATAPDIEPPRAPATISAQQDSFLSAYSFVCFLLFLILATLTFQLYCMFNPPIAIVTIIPKSQRVTLNGTLELGRLLQPITISQSVARPTTGHGHQDAKAAAGYLTFYNGQFQSVTVTAGTILTGNDGVQIVTDQDATIPAGNPPSYGQATVSAHAISPGARGNIAAYDINQIYANAVLVKNTSSFSGGQDERDFQTVAKTDITNAATPLKAALKQSIQGALQGQRKTNEQLQMLPCTPTLTSDYQPGEEASQVKVTLSQTCSAVAYNSQELESKAAAFLTRQAQHTPGAGYSLFGTVRINVKDATMSRTTPNLVFFSFHASGTWIYGLSYKAQEQMKSLIAGKTKQEAIRMLESMPGIKQAAIAWDENTKLPKNVDTIQLQIIVQTSALSIFF